MTRDYLADLHQQRFTLIDAIRGVAACSVLMRHLFLNDTLGPGLRKVFPLPLQLLSIWGAAGVYAFFVLSGFVIAHSLRHNALTTSGISNFALRRQLRLDPPYWAVLLLMLVTAALVPTTLKPLGLFGVLANLFYLQDITNVPRIVPVAWTLCIEIQFYLVFVLILWVGRRLSPAPGATATDSTLPSVAPWAPKLVFWLAVACMLVLLRHIFTAFFIGYWHYFTLGVFVYWGLRGVISTRWVGIYFALFALKMVASEWHGINRFGQMHSLSFTGLAVGLFTGLLIWYAGTHGQLASWGRNRVLQWLGRVSYSLYLIHPLVMLYTLPLAARASGDAGVALRVYFLSIALSLLSAFVLHRLVEAPSMKFAARLRGANYATLASSAP